MKLKHRFSTRTKVLFIDAEYECAECGRNGWNRGGMSLHHIFSTELGRASESALNAVPLCGYCHEKVTHSNEERIKYMSWTAIFLTDYKQGRFYKLKEIDHLFLKRAGEVLKTGYWTEE